eukprot:9852902-Heterocapsa_arctica.AAC.1
MLWKNYKLGPRGHTAGGLEAEEQKKRGVAECQTGRKGEVQGQGKRKGEGTTHANNYTKKMHNIEEPNYDDNRIRRRA